MTMARDVRLRLKSGVSVSLKNEVAQQLGSELRFTARWALEFRVPYCVFCWVFSDGR
jgi:hypothetical protein